MPVYGTIAAKFNDDGVTALYQAIVTIMNERTRCGWESSLPPVDRKTPSSKTVIIPPERVQYLAEIADTVDRYHAWSREQADAAERLWQLDGALASLGDDEADAKETLTEKRENLAQKLSPEAAYYIEQFPELREQYAQDEIVYTVRGNEIHTPVHRESLAGTRIPRVALPKYQNPGGPASLDSQRERARPFPLHRGSIPLQTDRRRPDAHVCRRRRSRPHQPPLQVLVPEPRGKASLHRLRLRNPLWPRPR